MLRIAVWDARTTSHRRGRPRHRNRTHNLANELLGRDPDNDATDEIEFTLDHAGNIRPNDAAGPS